MSERRIIIGTCALNGCDVNGGLILIQDKYVLVNVKGGYNMFHPECDPNPETTERPND